VAPLFNIIEPLTAAFRKVLEGYILMAAEITFVTDITIVIIIASLVTVLFNRVKLPTILGYLVAGAILGPFTGAVVKNVEAINLLAELGIILLLFFLGLEFSIKKLRKVSFVAIVAGGIEMPLMIAIGYYLGTLFGWSPMDALFLGAMICISSTAILVKILEDMGRMQEISSQIIFGILVVEDFGIVIIIAILSSIGAAGSVSYLEIGSIFLQLAIFITAFLALGHAILPRFINYIAKFHNAEMLVLAVLGLCFGVSLFTHWLGFSTASGAFLVGAILAESRHAGEIVRLTQPIRNMFAALFFVSIGMLFDASVLLPLLVPALIITLVNVGGKVFTCSLGTFLSGYGGETALQVGLGKSNMGEFSFVIAKIGQDFKVTSSFLYPISIFAAVITTLFTPYLMKVAPSVARGISNLAPSRLRTYFSYYTVWMSRSRQEAGGRRTASIAIRGILRNILIDVSIIAFVIIVLEVLSPQIRGWIHLPRMYEDMLFIGATIIFTFPFLLMALRNLGRLTDQISVLLQKSLPFTVNESRRYALRVARNLIRTLIIAIMVVFSFFTPFVPLFRGIVSPLLLIPVIIAIMVLYLFREYLSGLYDRVEVLYHKFFSKEAEHSLPDEKE